jgi:hypothetical protein
MVGQTLSGELVDADARVPDAGQRARIQAWRLDAAPGATVWIDLLSDDFDPMVSVLGPSIDGIPSSDDYSDRGWNSRLEITVPSDGQVIILVELYSEEGRGRLPLPASRTK